MTETAEMPINQAVEPDLTAGWTDNRLIRECLNGNQDAWSALVRRYKNMIFSVPLKYGLNREHAGEVFQTVCAELLSELPKLREPRALPKWILMVTSYNCSRRKSGGQKGQANAEEIRRWYRKELRAEADRIIKVVQREQALRDALSALPTPCRNVARLLFFEEPARPYSEIVQEPGLATRSMGFTRQSCLGRLRRKLGK